MILNKIVNKYFKYFKNKDLAKITSLLSKRVKLIDSNTTKVGRIKVLEEYTKIFSEIKKIELYLNRISIVKEIAYCEITLRIGKKNIDIIDVIEFDKNQQIKKIKAYKI